jgi:hypothetical protein
VLNCHLEENFNLLSDYNLLRFLANIFRKVCDSTLKRITICCHGLRPSKMKRT